MSEKKPRCKFRVCIDPGHGGVDPGAVGPNGLVEKDVVLSVARRLREKLVGRGYEVVLTRDGDSVPVVAPRAPGESYRANLQARCDIANEFGADLFVSLHCNGAPSLASGFEVWFAKGSVSGKKLAHLIRDEMAARLPEHINRGVQIDSMRYKTGMYVLRHTKMPAVLVEIEFITHRLISRKLATPEFQEAVAEAIATAIDNYIATS